MQKAKKLIACTVLIFFMLATATYAEEAKSPVPAYLLSFLLGFGTGHFYLGDDSASLFLIGELCGTGLIIASLFIALSGFDLFGSDPHSFESTIAQVVAGIGILTLTIFRIWEIIDIFGAVDDAKKRGTAASNNVSIKLSPTSFSLNYSF